jgi:hypothetical protein
MRVTVERSGGFAGIPVTRSVEEAGLSPDQVKAMAELIQAVDLSGHAEGAHKAGPQRDRFQYTVTIEASDGSHTLSVSEAEAPVPLRRLIDWVTSTAKQQEKPKE